MKMGSILQAVLHASILLVMVLLIIHSAQGFQFNCLCDSDSFEATDVRNECVFDLLDTLSGSIANPPNGGDFYHQKDCYGWPVYGHRWVDLTKPSAADCLVQAKNYIKETCKHRKGADVSTGTTCRMRFELYDFHY
ncbi:unnamed protein product [Linum trigynum]|uniref:Gnk2-homologous domain-containing protein n=1 Tax=Linum trigynum TaxID=586398 RepID=A0AAV2DWE4_9ROSI